MGIQVSAEGHIHIGHNEWASLEEIQEAVLRRQHPTLNVNDGACPHCQQQDEELFDYSKVPATKKRRQVANVEEPLELPKLNFKKLESKQTTNAQDETEHLSLPSTLRRG